MRGGPLVVTGRCRGGLSFAVAARMIASAVVGVALDHRRVDERESSRGPVDDVRLAEPRGRLLAGIPASYGALRSTCIVRRQGSTP